MGILKKHFGIILILLFSIIILSINLNKPFYGHHDWNGAWYSNFARNFLRYGFLETKFGSVMNSGPAQPKDFRYFTHYPPLLPIFLAISFKIFGIHEYYARLVPVLFSLFSIFLIYILALKIFDKKIALLAAAISIFMPIVIYFGKMPVQEILVIAPVLLSILLYFEFFNNPTRKNLILLLISLIFSHLINWPGYYVTPLFFAHYLIFSNSKHKLNTAIIFPATSVIMFMVHSLHLLLLTSDPLGGGMLKVLLYRLNISEPAAGYTTPNFIKLQYHLILAYFTKPVVFLSTISVAWSISQYKNIKKSQKIQLLIILLIFGITHNLVFRNMAFIHDYMIIYLWPFFAISASYGFFLVVQKFKIKSFAPQSLLAVLVLILMFTQSYKFVRSLQQSNSFKPGYDLGLIINKYTAPPEKTLVLSLDFNSYFDVFTYFYSDRNVTFTIPKIDQFEQDLKSKKYKLAIVIPQRPDTPKDIFEVLQQRYKATTIDQFVVFDLNESISASLSNNSGI